MTAKSTGVKTGRTQVVSLYWIHIRWTIYMIFPSSRGEGSYYKFIKKKIKNVHNLTKTLKQQNPLKIIQNNKNTLTNTFKIRWAQQNSTIKDIIMSLLAQNLHFFNWKGNKRNFFLFWNTTHAVNVILHDYILKMPLKFEWFNDEILNSNFSQTCLEQRMRKAILFNPRKQSESENIAIQSHYFNDQIKSLRINISKTKRWNISYTLKKNSQFKRRAKWVSIQCFSVCKTYNLL